MNDIDGPIRRFSMDNKEREMAREYYAIAEYAAFAKHLITVKAWQIRLTLEKTSLFVPNKWLIEDGTAHSYISVFGAATRIDEAVYQLALSGTHDGFSIIDRVVTNLKLDRKYRDKILWKEWSEYIQKRIENVQDLPFSVKKVLLIGDIQFVYNEIYDELSRRIDSQEFKKISNIQERPYNFPMHVDTINGMPVWTVGQAKIASGLYLSERKFKEKLPICNTEINFPLCENRGSVEENVHAFESEEFLFYNELLWELNPYDSSIEDYLKTGSYIFKRVKNGAPIYYHIGHKYLINGELEIAEEYFMKAIEFFELAFPDDFEGKVHDGSGYSEEYFYSLLYLGYINFVKGNIKTGEDTIELANNRLSYDTISFANVIEMMEELPSNEFVDWFKEEYITRPQYEHDHLDEIIKLEMKKNYIQTVGKELNTLSKNKPFRYIGSIKEGTTIFFGTDREHTINKKQYEELIKEFTGKKVLIGTSFNNPPVNSLGSWLLGNVSRRALASYVAPILIAEGYAQQIEKGKMELVFL
jgi:tetratricopeptide (TPR) repeat protein